MHSVWCLSPHYKREAPKLRLSLYSEPSIKVDQKTSDFIHIYLDINNWSPKSIKSSFSSSERIVIILGTTLLIADPFPQLSRIQVQVQAERSGQGEYHALPHLAAVIGEDLQAVAAPLQVVPVQNEIPSYWCVLPSLVA